jgi:hypothetical protein
MAAPLTVQVIAIQREEEKETQMIARNFLFETGFH